MVSCKRVILKSGHTIIIDSEDFNRVTAYKWCVSGNKHVMRYFKDKGVYLHHFIAGQPLKPFEMDHINQNPLDNRKSNLRIVSKRIQTLNRPVRKDNTSGTTGIYKKYGKWAAAVFMDSKYIHIGLFTNYEDAVKARNKENLWINNKQLVLPLHHHKLWTTLSDV